MSFYLQMTLVIELNYMKDATYNIVKQYQSKETLQK